MKAPLIKAFWILTPLLIIGALAWMISVSLPSDDEISIPCSSNTVAVARLANPGAIESGLSSAYKRYHAMQDIRLLTNEALQADTLGRLLNSGPEISILWEKAGTNLATVFILHPKLDRANWNDALQGWSDMRGFTLRQVDRGDFTVLEAWSGRKILMEFYMDYEAVWLSGSPNALENYLSAPKSNLVQKRSLPKEALLGISFFINKGEVLLEKASMEGAIPVTMRGSYPRLDLTVYQSEVKTKLDFSGNFRFHGDKCLWPDRIKNLSAVHASGKKAPIENDPWTDWSINTEAEEVILTKETLDRIAGFDPEMLDILKKEPQLACGFGSEAEKSTGFCLKLPKEEGLARMQEIIKRSTADPVATAGNTTVWRIRKDGKGDANTYFLASRNEWLIMGRNREGVISRLENLPESFTQKAFSGRILLKQYLNQPEKGWIGKQYGLFPLTVSSLKGIDYEISGSNLSGSIQVMNGSYLLPKLLPADRTGEGARGLKGEAGLARSDQKPGFAFSGQVGDSMVIFSLSGAERLAFRQNNPLADRPTCATMPDAVYAMVITKGGITAMGFGQTRAKSVLVYPKGEPAATIKVKKHDNLIYICIQTGEREIYYATFQEGKFSDWSQLLDKVQIIGAPVLSAENKNLFVVYPIAGDSIRAIPVSGSSASLTRHDSVGSGRIQLFAGSSPETEGSHVSLLTTNGFYHRMALDSARITFAKQIYRPNSGTRFWIEEAENDPDRFCIVREDGQQLTVYGTDLEKRFSIPATGGNLSLEAYLFGGVQEYFRIQGTWYNRLGRPLFSEGNSQQVDFFFEQNGEVKGARVLEGKLKVYRFD